MSIEKYIVLIYKKNDLIFEKELNGSLLIDSSEIADISCSDIFEKDCLIKLIQVSENIVVHSSLNIVSDNFEGQSLEFTNNKEFNIEGIRFVVKAIESTSEKNDLESKGIGAGIPVVEAAVTTDQVSPVDANINAEQTFSSDIPIDDFIYPSKGSVVEVLVAWEDRIVDVHHFPKKKTVTIGNSKNVDISIPVFKKDFKFDFLEIQNNVNVNIAKSMPGHCYFENGEKYSLYDLSKLNKLTTHENHNSIYLNQGEMVRVGVMGDKISLIVRYVENAPKVNFGSFFDFTAAESVGVLLSVLCTIIFALYMAFYNPLIQTNEVQINKSLAKATVTFKPPKPRPVRVKPTPPPVVKKIEKPKPPKKKIITKIQEKAKKKKSKKGGRNNAPPKAVAKARPTKVNNIKTNQKTARQGGQIGTGAEGSNMKTKKVDVSKTGLLATFGGGGSNAQLDKVYSGSGKLQGLAMNSKGESGSSKSIEGNDVGQNLQISTANSAGDSIQGVSGVSTKGRSSGNTSYGRGTGISKSDGVSIDLSGNSNEFVSSIDKDAIKRIIRANQNAIKGCYDLALNTNKNVSGKIVLEWSIVNGGKMVSPRVRSSTVKNAELGKCITRRLQVLKFPDPGPNEIAKVAYPFVFQVN